MFQQSSGLGNGAAQGESRAVDTSGTGSTEPDLIALARDGDEAAFTRLYDLHYDRVYRYLRFRVRRMEDAEDLTQRVFLQAWRALPRYRATEAPFIAWLFTIAHNAAMSFFRSQKPETYLEEDHSDRDAAYHLVDGADERIDQEALREAVLRLGSDQQLVITMRFLEGFEYGEIASAISKSEGNVRVIQHRALQQLRKLLGDWKSGDGEE